MSHKEHNTEPGGSFEYPINYIKTTQPEALHEAPAYKQYEGHATNFTVSNQHILAYENKNPLSGLIEVIIKTINNYKIQC